LDTVLDKKWSDHIILDEPVRKSNDIGTLSFARAGKNTRGTQLFINLKNNARLDTVSYGETLGFPAFGWVSGGMDVVKKICVDYNDEPRKKLDSIKEDVDSFLKKNFPDLDYIKKAVILK
jgi:cyclophilin family peptidyl-prolyl cis-trans isomerase